MSAKPDEKRSADAGDATTPTPQPHDETTSSSDVTTDAQAPPRRSESSIWMRIYRFLTWCPPRLRWDPNKPAEFSLSLNILFGFAGAFTVANLYYNHPILNILARDFNVTYEDSSLVPTLAQAGYATGLLLLCPLGDLLPRRPFTLALVFFTATLWYAATLR